MTRVMFSIPDKLLAQIDETAKSESRNRSELLREAFRRYVSYAKIRDIHSAVKNAAAIQALME